MTDFYTYIARTGLCRNGATWLVTLLLTSEEILCMRMWAEYNSRITPLEEAYWLSQSNDNYAIRHGQLKEPVPSYLHQREHQPDLLGDCHILCRQVHPVLCVCLQAFQWSLDCYTLMLFFFQVFTWTNEYTIISAMSHTIRECLTQPVIL